jgi:arylsulfatase A-like enzyme
MHGADLYDEVVRVPLILSAPGLESAVGPSQVSLVDLMPTLLELAGAPIDGLDGMSLLPLASDDRPAFIVGTDKGTVSQLALRQPPWKLIVHVQSGEADAYELDEDPGELVSRPDDAPGELRERLYDELEAVSRQALSAEEQALVEQRLSDLGYL